jgi:hypothetical protein
MIFYKWSTGRYVFVCANHSSMSLSEYMDELVIRHRFRCARGRIDNQILTYLLVCPD